LGKVITGIKAGVVSGAILGIVLASFIYLSLILFKEEFMFMISLLSDSQIGAEQLYDIMLLMGPILYFIIGIILGLIVGAIYGRAYDKIPGRTSIIKGIIIGIILWLILPVLLGLGVILPYSYYAYGLGVDLITYLIFGVLLGYFYNRFTPKAVG